MQNTKSQHKDPVEKQTERDATFLNKTGISNQGPVDNTDYTVTKDDVHRDKGKYDITEETATD